MAVPVTHCQQTNVLRERQKLLTNDVRFSKIKFLLPSVMVNFNGWLEAKSFPLIVLVGGNNESDLCKL